MKAFDPKWNKVYELIFFEGIGGEPYFVSEKSQTLESIAGGSIARTHPDFPRGALYFDDKPNAGFCAISGGTNFLFQDQVIEISFAPLSWGLSSYSSIVDYGGKWRLALKNGNTLSFEAVVLSYSAYFEVAHTIDNPDGFLNVRHNVRIFISKTSISLELDGAVVSVQHGASSFAGSGASGLWFGSQAAANKKFIGYIGPFRWTADLRQEEAGKPFERFPTLAAVDALREKVVFHTHCEPTSSGEIDDTCGNVVAMRSGAIVTGSRKFGIGGLKIGQGPRIGPNPGFVFGTRDFSLEFSLVTAVGSTFDYIFSIVDSSGQTALALQVRNASYPAVVILFGGSSHLYDPIISAGSRIALCRTGNLLRLFGNAATPIFSLDIGDTSIDGDGYIYLGAPPGVVQNGYAVIDEVRLTVGVNRYPSGLLPVGPLTEPFSDFGPRSFSGRVEDQDGTPLQRTVRCHHRKFGNMISETTSAADGSFVLPAGDIDEHYIVVLDDAENALIYDRITPVVIT